MGGQNSAKKQPGDRHKPNVLIRFPESLANELRKIARKKGKSLTAVAVSLMQEKVDAYRFNGA